MYHKWDMYKPIFSFYTEGNLYRKSVARQTYSFLRQFSENRCQFFGAGCHPFSFLFRNTLSQLFMFDQKDDSGKVIRITFKTQIRFFYMEKDTFNHEENRWSLVTSELLTYDFPLFFENFEPKCDSKKNRWLKQLSTLTI